MLPAWVSDAIFYQIFPERFRNGDPSNDPPGVQPWGGQPTRDSFFGGDLRGIIDSLPYLSELGVNALYLTPIFKAGTNHKYDTHDYLTIDPHFGDLATFDELVRQAHASGIRIVLDGVFNHCGDGFWAFQDVQARGPHSQYWDWFTVYSFPLRANPYPNYATCGGAAYLPRLNTDHPEVRRHLFQVARYWLERGIDGWRLDVPYEVAPDFWREFRLVVKQHFPQAYLVAEEWRDAWSLLQGDQFDGAMNYRLRELVLDFLVRNALSAEAFRRALDDLRRHYPSQADMGMLNLLGSHDTPRLLTLCQGQLPLAKLALAFLLTYPGAPMLYYGDEVGMMGDSDPDCRRPMLWDQQQWNTDLLQFVRRLTTLRQERVSLRRGAFRPVLAQDRVFAYVRGSGPDALLVVLNSTATRRDVTIPVPTDLAAEGQVLRELLTEPGGSTPVVQGQLPLRELPPRTALVFARS
ncbi:MAG: glycoside hydrolase family 13 protein [Deinococcus sp.]|nr:glycoside hydrolase family 13 protein [Deinococcus sp.]